MDRTGGFNRRGLFWLAVGSLLVSLAGGIRAWIQADGWLNPVRIEMEAYFDAGGKKEENRLQVYLDTGDGFSERESRRIRVAASGEFDRFVVYLPAFDWRRIRLDPLARPGEVSIRSLRVVSSDGAAAWRGPALEEILSPAEQVRRVEGGPADSLTYALTGNDPQFFLEIPEPTLAGFRWPALVLAVGVCFICSFLSGLLVWFVVERIRDHAVGWLGLAHTCALLSLLAGLGLLYLFFARQTEADPVPQNLAGHNLYFHLTEAFLHGRLDLLEDPVRPLRDLENPFDPVANKDLRLHDSSYYNGRYYVYFGPAPVIGLYLPLRVLTGIDLPDRWADAIFLFGGLLLLVLTLVRLLRSAGVRPSLRVLALGALALGITTGALMLMARSVVYEVALSSALFWTALAVFLAVEWSHRPRNGLLVGVGVSLGMAMASRHSFVLIAAFLCIFLWVRWMLERPGFGQVLTRSVALGLPTAAIGLLLLVHNQIRFDDPAEFGHNYQIGVVDPAEVTFLDPDNVPYNAVLNLFQPPAFSAEFPFVWFPGNLLEWVDVPPRYIRAETGLGLLVANPYLVFLPVFLWLGLRSSGRSPGGWIILLVGMGVIQFGVIACFSYGSPRYSMDYLPWLILLFFYVWGLSKRESGSSRWRRGADRLIGILVGWSVLVNLGLALGLIF